MEQQTPAKKLWFKRKSYGWGWTPSTWEGWSVIAIFILLLLLNFRTLNPINLGEDAPAIFTVRAVILAVVLILVCYWKGEKPKWMWGGKEIGKK